MRILVINAIGTDAYNETRKRILSKYARPDVEISMTSLKDVPEQLAHLSKEMVIVPKVVEKVKEAETNGFSGVLINCFLDPGLHASREVVKIPVVGAGEASMMVAAMLGSKFSILSLNMKMIPVLENNAKLCGLDSKLASVRSIDIPVAEIQKGLDLEKFGPQLMEKIKHVVENDGAEVVTVACTGSVGLADKIQKRINIPIVDPSIAPYKMTEMFTDLYERTGLSHSKIAAYLPPPLLSLSVEV